ncbi:MAG TPA: Crp/Fnr family transcriptional regulator [Terriglobales bacterium]|nr:Crp/Fnr family transcriptional regulator [Terriglobales bacterium]
MNAPYGLAVIESCCECKLRQGFCDFSSETLRAFNAMGHKQTYPPGALLFAEGQNPRGILVLCSGRVKLSTASREGKVLILKVASPGAVLGLSAVLSGVPYEATAETVTPCRVNFLTRDHLAGFLSRYGEAGIRAARAVSKEYQDACLEIQEILLAPSSAGKLAKLLLSWAEGGGNGTGEGRVRSMLTHEEMAQMIGASRETVTRVLTQLKRKQIIRLEGSTLVIRNRMGLEQLAT